MNAKRESSRRSKVCDRMNHESGSKNITGSSLSKDNTGIMYVYFEVIIKFRATVIAITTKNELETFHLAHHSDVIWKIQDSHIEWLKDRFEHLGHGNERTKIHHQAIEFYLKDLLQMTKRIRGLIPL